MPITLRPVVADDEPFLLQVYASTRLEELAPLRWSQEEVDAFLLQQGRAQHAHYRSQFQDMTYSVILADGRAAGRLYVGRWPSEVRIVDIALLPPFRSTGIGSRLIADLQHEAAEKGLPLTIHVETSNRARRLYHRLGFHLVRDEGVYLFMEWAPPGSRA